jgi:hypothetical protein
MMSRAAAPLAWAARRAAPAALALVLCGALSGTAARAQGMDIVEETDSAPAQGSIPCSEINNRAMEATLVIRQHASALSIGFAPDTRGQAMVMLAWLDQWTGRLRGLVDLGEFSQCLDDGDAETYRRVLASASQIGNQAREDLLRPAARQAPPRPRR